MLECSKAGPLPRRLLDTPTGKTVLSRRSNEEGGVSSGKVFDLGATVLHVPPSTAGRCWRLAMRPPRPNNFKADITMRPELLLRRRSLRQQQRREAYNIRNVPSRDECIHKKNRDYSYDSCDLRVRMIHP